jgi:hypothetical protein
MRIVGGDKKGSLKYETVTSPKGPGPEKYYAWWPAAYIKDRPVLSPEGAPHESKTVTVK